MAGAGFSTKMESTGSITRLRTRISSLFSPYRDSTHDVISIAHKKNDNLVVDFKPLQAMLGRVDIKDLPIAIISIAGASRTGKTFILNFFLRYLKHSGSSRWFRTRFRNIDEGMKWSCESPPDTEGVLVWDEVFVLSGEKRKIAVIIVDTEGLYDHDSSRQKNSDIFSISALLSSVQIVNVRGQIAKRDFEFVESVVAMETEINKRRNKDCREIEPPSGQKEDMQDLRFLVRDWEGSEYEFGGKDGEKYLKTKVSKMEKIPNIKNWMEKFPDNVKAFLMPHPGVNLLRAKQTPANSDLDREFRDQVKNFVELVLNPDEVTVKNVGGIELNGAGVSAILDEYSTIFRSSFPPPAAIAQAQSRFVEHQRLLAKLVKETMTLREPDNYLLHEYELMLRKAVMKRQEGLDEQDYAFVAGAVAGLGAAVTVGVKRNADADP